MKSLIKYLIMTFFTVCYLQAAFEVDAGPISNTFGDQYDTYILVDNEVSIPSQKVEQSLDWAMLPDFVIHNRPIRLLGTNSNKTRTYWHPFYNYRRYINFCSLLI